MLDFWAVLLYMSFMTTAKADNRRRVQIPNIKAGQVFANENNGAGVIVLHEVRPVEQKPAKCKLVKKDGFTVLHTDKQVRLETIKELLSEFSA